MRTHNRIGSVWTASLDWKDLDQVELWISDLSLMRFQILFIASDHNYERFRNL